MHGAVVPAQEANDPEFQHRPQSRAGTQGWHPLDKVDVSHEESAACSPPYLRYISVQSKPGTRIWLLAKAAKFMQPPVPLA